MLNPNLATLNDYTFARLGEILGSIAPISNEEPILFSLGEPQKPTPQILIKTQNINNTLIIEIIDKGIGMSKKTQKMIFEKFFREETGDIHNVRGHGIGLTFVKKVINLVNAKIFVDSQLGYGSNFKIEIPLSLKN